MRILSSLPRGRRPEPDCALEWPGVGGNRFILRRGGHLGLKVQPREPSSSSLSLNVKCGSGKYWGFPGTGNPRHKEKVEPPFPFPDPRHCGWVPAWVMCVSHNTAPRYRSSIIGVVIESLYLPDTGKQFSFYLVVPATLSGKGCSPFTDRENRDSEILNNTPRARWVQGTGLSPEHYKRGSSTFLNSSLPSLFKFKRLWNGGCLALRTFLTYLIGPCSLIINPRAPFPTQSKRIQTFERTLMWWAITGVRSKTVPLSP